MPTELIIDFNDDAEKRTLWGALRKCRGTMRITIKQYRKARSDRQNRYYWPCFVNPLAEYLREQGEHVTPDQAHEILRGQFLQMHVQDDRAGLISFVRSTTDLDVGEFNRYLDECGHWLWEMFGIQVPEPETYHLQGGESDGTTGKEAEF